MKIRNLQPNMNTFDFFFVIIFEKIFFAHFVFGYFFSKLGNSEIIYNIYENIAILNKVLI